MYGMFISWADAQRMMKECFDDSREDDSPLVCNLKGEALTQEECLKEEQHRWAFHTYDSLKCKDPKVLTHRIEFSVTECGNQHGLNS